MQLNGNCDIIVKVLLYQKSKYEKKGTLIMVSDQDSRDVLLVSQEVKDGGVQPGKVLVNTANAGVAENAFSRIAGSQSAFTGPWMGMMVDYPSRFLSDDSSTTARNIGDPMIAEDPTPKRLLSPDTLVEEVTTTLILPEPKSSVWQYARTYRRAGYSVIPLDGTSADIDDWQEYQERLPAERELESWFGATDGNIGIVTGRISNLLALGIDVSKCDLTFADRVLSIPATATVEIKYGTHIYLFFYYPYGLEINSLAEEHPGVYFYAEGGFVVAPPSVLPDGSQVRWKDPLNSRVAAIPDWLLQIFVKKTEHQPKVIVNDSQVSKIVQLGQTLVPLEDHQVAALNSFNPTDAGQGEAIAYLYGDQLRYDHARKLWLIWESPRWRVDTSGQATRYALLTARARLRAATVVEGEEKRKALVGWSLHSENRYPAHNALAMARDTKQFSISHEQMDRDPWLLGCANGVVNLQTQKLQVGNQSDLISLSTYVDFIPDAKCTRWDGFLKEVFGDDDLINFIQRAAGYSLTGLTEEQYSFFCYGTGANGKSTFLNVLRTVFGEYARNTPFETLQELKGDRASNDLAALCGVRLVTASEVRDGARLNEGRIKSLTGQDPITCRYLYGEYFTYQPTMKIWLAANHKPVIRGTDEAIWRRILLIPFNVYFSKDKADMKLSKDLEAEAPGILAWVVRGCKEWQEKGLCPPATVRRATQDYRQEMDALEQFLDECTDRGPTLKVQASVLYEAYKSWVERNGEFRISGAAFGRRIGEKGFQKITSTYVVYHGLGLKSII